MNRTVASWLDWLTILFPELSPGTLKTKIILALKRRGEHALLTFAAVEYGRGAKKSIDSAFGALGVMSAPGGSLTAEQARAAADDFVVKLRARATRVGDAAQAYAPHQMAVAAAEAQFGHDSAQAALARADRHPFAQALEDAIESARLGH